MNTAFRFEYGQFFLFFTEKEILGVNVLSKRLRVSILLLILALIASIVVVAWLKVQQLFLLGGAAVLLLIFFQPMMSFFVWIRKRRWRKLSNEEILQRSKAVFHIPYSEVKQLDLDRGSLSLEWDKGIKRKSVQLKFDKSKFEELQTFLANKIPENLAIIGPKEPQSEQLVSLPETTQFPGKIRRFSLFGAIAALSLFVNAYLFAYLQTHISHYLLPYGSPISVPSNIFDELYFFTAVGLGCWILAYLYLYSASKDLKKLDRVRFSRLPIISISTIFFIALTLSGFMISIYLAPYGIYFPPKPPAPAQEISSFMFYQSLFIGGFLIFFLFDIVMIIVYPIYMIVIMKKMSSYYSKFPFIGSTLLFVTSFLSLLLAYILTA